MGKGYEGLVLSAVRSATGIEVQHVSMYEVAYFGMDAYLF